MPCNRARRSALVAQSTWNGVFGRSQRVLGEGIDHTFSQPWSAEREGGELFSTPCATIQATSGGSSPLPLWIVLCPLPFLVVMADPAKATPPPVAAKPNSIARPLKRAPLKRTFSAGGPPKKSSIVSNPKASSIAGSLPSWAPAGSHSAAAKSSSGTPHISASNSIPSTTGELLLTYCVISELRPALATNSDTIKTSGGSAQADSGAPVSPKRPASRPPSGSLSYATMSSPRMQAASNQGTGDASSSGTAQTGNSRLGVGRLSSAAYANFAGHASSFNGALSPRGTQSSSMSEPIEEVKPIAGDLHDNGRPRRPAAPPRPATLRSSQGRSSVGSTAAPSNGTSSSSEHVTSGTPPKLAPSPVKTGAQLRPPVPKKNISQSIFDVGTASKSVGASPLSSPAPTEHPLRSSSPSAAQRLTAENSDASSSADQTSDDDTSDVGLTGSAPSVRRTQPPRMLGSLKSSTGSASSLLPYVLPCSIPLLHSYHFTTNSIHHQKMHTPRHGSGGPKTSPSTSPFSPLSLFSLCRLALRTPLSPASLWAHCRFAMVTANRRECVLVHIHFWTWATPTLNKGPRRLTPQVNRVKLGRWPSWSGAPNTLTRTVPLP